MLTPALPVCASTGAGPSLISPAGAEYGAELAGCSLAELFRRVQQGEENAFSELYRHTRHHLRGVVYRVLRSADRVEDVVQETYLRIWVQRHQFRPELGSILGWMTTIARRRSIDRARVSAPPRPPGRPTPTTRLLSSTQCTQLT